MDPVSEHQLPPIETDELLACQASARRYRRMAALQSLLTIALLAASQLVPAHAFLIQGQEVESTRLIAVLSGLALITTLVTWGAYLYQRNRQHSYAEVLQALEGILRSKELTAAKQGLEAIQPVAEKSPLTRSVLQTLQPRLHEHLDELTRQKLHWHLDCEVQQARSDYLKELDNTKRNVALLTAEVSIRETHNRLLKRREHLLEHWERKYSEFSWWNKMKYQDGPDFSELDQAIDQLRQMHHKLHAQHALDLKRLGEHFSMLQERAEARLLDTQRQLEQFISQVVERNLEKDLPFKAALWFSALSVPVSLWDDLSTAGNIYDALREVNGNYAGMSDSEIWLHTLFLPAEQLAGLTALAKGAYFEQLVAADTGGRLFEHFNNPETDIMIDGQAFQLKATDSEHYVNSVAAGIPVISTSEVAESTSAIDSGYSNAELESSVDLALGGTVIDASDTALDTLLSGIGGLGVFATLQGINHAGKRYEEGADGFEAIFEGTSVALEGTARALVGTAEMGFNVLNSRPSRFIGRLLLKGLDKVDDKLMGK